MRRYALVGLVIVCLSFCAGCRRQTDDILMNHTQPSGTLISDIRTLSRIEVVAFVNNGTAVGGPAWPKGSRYYPVVGVLDKKKSPVQLASAVSELSAMMKQSCRRYTTGTQARIWLRLYPAGKPYAYYCALIPEDRYLGIDFRDDHPEDPEHTKWDEVGVIREPTDEFIKVIAGALSPRVRSKLFPDR